MDGVQSETDQAATPENRDSTISRIPLSDRTRKRLTTDLPFEHADAHANSGRPLLLSGRRTRLLGVGHENLVRSQSVGYGRGTVSGNSEASDFGRVPPRASGALSSVSRLDGPASSVRKQLDRSDREWTAGVRQSPDPLHPASVCGNTPQHTTREEQQRFPVDGPSRPVRGCSHQPQSCPIGVDDV